MVRHVIQRPLLQSYQLPLHLRAAHYQPEQTKKHLNHFPTHIPSLIIVLLLLLLWHSPNPPVLLLVGEALNQTLSPIVKTGRIVTDTTKTTGGRALVMTMIQLPTKRETLVSDQGTEEPTTTVSQSHHSPVSTTSSNNSSSINIEVTVEAIPSKCYFLYYHNNKSLFPTFYSVQQRQQHSQDLLTNGVLHNVRHVVICQLLTHPIIPIFI